MLYFLQMFNFKKLKIVFLLFLVIFVFTIILFEFSGSKKNKAEIFVIKRGENILQVANNLKSEGYIDFKIPFVFKSLKHKNYTKIKAGKYSLKNRDSILNILIKGEHKKEFLTIIPGWDLDKIAEDFSFKGIIKKQAFLERYKALSEKQDEEFKQKFSFLKDKPKGIGLEGYFFPDTYEIDSEKEADFLINQILSNFDKKLNKELRLEIEKQKKTIFEIIVMASMLEKEVISYEDKAIVSGILQKRLRSGMLLEVDSTYLYNKNDKNSDSLYNTYKYSGLPVAPIANPSLSSIKAAIYPKETNYWFYLSAKDGKTIFSKNFNEHLINKFKYLDNEK